jgi:hypothetical protein
VHDVTLRRGVSGRLLSLSNEATNDPRTLG